MEKVHQYPSWLIIVDNVTDIGLVRQYLPQTGTKSWGNGQLLVTTQDSHSVPSDHSQSRHVFFSEGMEVSEAVELLTQIAGVSSDDEKLKDVAMQLDKLPLGLACAAMYVKRSSVSWSEYLEKLKDGKMRLNEKLFESSNQVYKVGLATAVLLALEEEVQAQDFLKHAFEYLALLAHAPISLKFVTRIYCLSAA